MTPQERDLTEAAANRMLGNRTHAAVLTALLEANGRILSASQVALVPPTKGYFSKDTDLMGKVRICLLRKFLDRVGFVATVEHVHKTGYHIPLDSRARIMARLSEFTG